MCYMLAWKLSYTTIKSLLNLNSSICIPISFHLLMVYVILMMYVIISDQTSLILSNFTL
jgi:hypothetical protein